MTSHLLSTQIASALRTRIIDGHLPFGAKISDKRLATELGASRTPVREALIALQGEGFVTVVPQSGTFVFNPSVEEIGAICELRAIMEAGALRVAAERDPQGFVASLSDVVSAASIACDDGDFGRCEALDTHFHETLVALASNPYVDEAYRTLSGKIRALRRRLPAERGRISRAIDQHRRTLDLVATGRIDAAEAELRKHMRNVHVVLAERMRADGGA